MQKFLAQSPKSPVARFNLAEFLEPCGYSGQKLAIPRLSDSQKSATDGYNACFGSFFGSINAA
tara:strand:- start:304 stop:492 length:189 start_codon:yes stop_codon:yes gene_type:complete